MKTITSFNRFKSSGSHKSSQAQTGSSMNWDKSDGSSFREEVINLPYGCEYSQMKGYSDQNYGRRRRAGVLLPFTPWEQIFLTDTASGECDFTRTYTASGNWTRYFREGDVVNNNMWHNEIITVQDMRRIANQYSTDQYVQKAASRLANDMSFDAGTFLAELSKMIAQFKGILKRVVSLIASMRIEKLWLEARYAWRTLFFEMDDLALAIAALETGAKRLLPKQRVGSSHSESDKTEEPYETWWYSGVKVTTTTTHVSLRGNVIASIQPPKFKLNLISTAWETLTLSFILDWIVQVGDWIESMRFLTMSKEYTAAGGVEVEYEKIITLEGDFKTSSSYDISGEFSFTRSSHGTLTRRMPVSIPTHPQVTTGLPEWDQILDLMSLIRQATTSARGWEKVPLFN